MSMTRIGLIAAAALLAGSVGIATAQTTTQGKCWDSATNQVRDMTTTQMGGTSTTTTTPSGSAGSGTTSSTTSVSPGAGSTASTPGSRPAAAAGLPDCR
jgi:hypothetical protein